MQIQVIGQDHEVNIQLQSQPLYNIYLHKSMVFLSPQGRPVLYLHSSFFLFQYPVTFNSFYNLVIIVKLQQILKVK